MDGGTFMGDIPGGPGSTASLSPPHLRGTTWSQKQ